MNKYKKAAIKILQEVKKPLHYKEITRLALEKGILETDGKTPEASMNAQLTMDIKNKGKASNFIKVAPAIFALNPSRQEKPFENAITKDKGIEEQSKIASGFTGKAGEYLVCSQLLFRGFNASIMSVDVGLDIVATKNGRMYGIQVKTSNLNNYKTYVFDIRKASFKRHEASNIYYIFVLHSDIKDNFLILPVYEIEKLVQQGVILEVGHGKRYRVNIKVRDGKVYLGKRSNDMSYYLNNWNLIK